MTILLTIGDFSRMTYISVKALRHYHELGLLEPARIDPTTGYRSYDAAQVPTAQVIRRFRDLGMPLEQVKQVIDAPDVTARNQAIEAHLQRMEDQLTQTQQTVSALRILLEQPTRRRRDVEYRSVGPTAAIAVSESVRMSDLDAWWAAAFDDLHGTLAGTRLERGGPDGALYDNDFFQQGHGEVVAFVPVTGKPQTSGRVRRVDIPAAELAIMVHHGSFDDLDQTYGALGTLVAERALGVAGPIREHYLVTDADTDDQSRHRIEVCWPIFQTTPTTIQHAKGAVSETGRRGSDGA